MDADAHPADESGSGIALSLDGDERDAPTSPVTSASASASPSGRICPSASVTDWDVIHDARGDGESARQAMDRIARRYWPAVYIYLRQSGRDAAAAADLTQGFLCDVILDGDLIERADPGRGRFRAFLYTSLRNYVVQRHRHETRQRRHPGAPILDIDAVTGPGSRPATATPAADDPARAFTAEWARTLVRASLDRAATECARGGLGAHWIIFEHRVARPLLDGTPARDYEDLVMDLGLEDAAQAANMMITAKRRFARALRAEVGRTVSDPAEIDTEIRDLLSELGSRP
jgi:RNA polymerase sigma-70 factor (ECF subfamily)